MTTILGQANGPTPCPTIGKILIVDDEASIRRALRTTLRELGFEVVEAARGEEAISLVRTVKFAAMLLDINMPGMGGIEACRRIRQFAPKLSILMLTVRDSEDDKVEALEAGADDYVTKPFALRELTARIRAAVRRSQAPAAPATAPIRIGEIELDPQRRLVQKSGQAIHFTPKEFDLLHYLMSHPGFPITHARLLSSVWAPNTAANSNTSGPSSASSARNSKTTQPAPNTCSPTPTSATVSANATAKPTLSSANPHPARRERSARAFHRRGLVWGGLAVSPEAVHLDS